VIRAAVHESTPCHHQNRAGHSIGRWENDVLIVDTVGFLPGVHTGSTRHIDKLHVVERFSLDPKTMILTRSYTAEDPTYFKGQDTGSDTVQPADAVYTEDHCKEQGFLDYSRESSKDLKIGARWRLTPKCQNPSTGVIPFRSTQR
jgi:hypothetical protein